MKTMKRWLMTTATVLGLALFLPLTAPAVTTQSANSIPAVGQTSFAYDVSSVHIVSDKAFTDSDATALFVLSFGPVGGLDAAKSEMTTVTSWADKGIIPDLNPGRWVMKGEPTKWNFWKSGLPGPKASWSKEFPFLQLEKSKADFSNFITGEVPASSVKLPPGPEVIKVPLGQHVLGEGN